MEKFLTDVLEIYFDTMNTETISIVRTELSNAKLYSTKKPATKKMKFEYAQEHVHHESEENDKINLLEVSLATPQADEETKPENVQNDSSVVSVEEPSKKSTPRQDNEDTFDLSFPHSRQEIESMVKTLDEFDQNTLKLVAENIKEEYKHVVEYVSRKWFTNMANRLEHEEERSSHIKSFLQVILDLLPTDSAPSDEDLKEVILIEPSPIFTRRVPEPKKSNRIHDRLTLLLEIVIEFQEFTAGKEGLDLLAYNLEKLIPFAIMTATFFSEEKTLYQLLSIVTTTRSTIEQSSSQIQLDGDKNLRGIYTMAFLELLRTKVEKKIKRDYTS